jgi:hypothetical protein
MARAQRFIPDRRFALPVMTGPGPVIHAEPGKAVRLAEENKASSNYYARSRIILFVLRWRSVDGWDKV